jgi:hypothetical protein
MVMHRYGYVPVRLCTGNVFTGMVMYRHSYVPAQLYTGMQFINTSRFMAGGDYSCNCKCDNEAKHPDAVGTKADHTGAPLRYMAGRA